MIFLNKEGKMLGSMWSVGSSELSFFSMKSK